MTNVMANQAASVVRERDRGRLWAMAATLGLGGVLVGAVLGYVWFQVQGVRLSYELEDLRSLRGDVEEQNRKLRLELATLSSLARVESTARRLGLTEPAHDQVRLAREFVLDDGQSVVRTAAESGTVASPRRGSSPP